MFGVAFQHFPVGQGMFALLMIDHVARLGRRVVAQWKVDTAAVQCGLAPAQGGVGLFGFAVMELPRQLAVAVGVARQNDNPDRKSTRLNSSHMSISYAV